jgi:ankyrin repeat protein
MDHWDSVYVLAARDGHADVVEFPLDNDVKIETKGKIGLSMLSVAAVLRHLSVAKLLLDKGTDVESYEPQYVGIPRACYQV